MTRRPSPAALVVALLAISLATAVLAGAPAAGDPGSGPAGSATAATPRPTRIPIPGHEVFGYVPYWEMDDGIGEHLAGTELTTLALFSVTHGRESLLASGENGYRRITGEIGRRLIAEAHERGTRVELVYTSFGEGKNEAFFNARGSQDRAIAELVGLAADLEVDGINVDVELLAAADIPAYGDFVGRLRTSLRAAMPGGQVSVATTANERGAAMALAATRAGADRIFLMGYDYHWSGSGPGASAPLARRDGERKDLPWSLDTYRDIGVPVERTLLGLPLYGMAWPVAEPELGAERTGRGEAWIPSDNLGILADETLAPTRDHLEGVEFIARPTGDTWEAIYFDSPATLVPKLGLADERGLAGAGFWALGYERGLPEYTELISTFAAGELEPPR
jgi:spore germination protein YaaH